MESPTENSKQVRKKAIAAWCLYDVANSAFFTIVTTFIFAPYFTQKIVANNILGTQLWGYAIAIAGLIVALSSPIIGAIADHTGRRKPWLIAFSLLAIGSSALLWFAAPHATYITYTLVLVMLGTIGVDIAMVFYNALLPHVAPSKMIGRVSGWGWGAGYIGGLIALSICLFGLVTQTPHWLNRAEAEHIRICGPFIAVWFAVFAIPLIIVVKDTPKTGLSLTVATRKGLATLWTTLKQLPRHRPLLLFLLAHMVYTDGLNTIFIFGGIYAAGTFGMSIDEVILFGIFMNISAGIGSALFAWLDDIIGPKRIIMLALLMLTTFTLIIVTIHSKPLFWVFALCLSLFVGPAQAASRSLMTRLTTPPQRSQLFGLYALSGKVTAYLGPWLVGLITVMMHSQRWGIAVILIFFIIGASLLACVRQPNQTMS